MMCLDWQKLLPTTDFFLGALGVQHASANSFSTPTCASHASPASPVSSFPHRLFQNIDMPFAVSYAACPGIPQRNPLLARLKTSLRKCMEADHEAAAALQRNSPSFPWKMALLSLPFECMELATSYIQGGTRINLSLFGQLVHRTMGNYLLGSAAYEALSGSSALALFCSAPAVRWAFFAANVWGLVGSAWRLLAAVHAWEYLLGALGDMTGAQGPLGPIPEGHFLERALQCPVVFTVMDRPRVLSCGHTFDASAIGHLWRRGAVCFSCQQPVAWVAPNIALLAARASCMEAEEQGVLPRGFLRDEQDRVLRFCWVDRTGVSFAEEAEGRVRNFKLEEAQDAWVANFL